MSLAPRTTSYLTIRDCSPRPDRVIDKFVDDGDISLQDNPMPPTHDLAGILCSFLPMSRVSYRPRRFNIGFARFESQRALAVHSPKVSDSFTTRNYSHQYRGISATTGNPNASISCRLRIVG